MMPPDLDDLIVAAARFIADRGPLDAALDRVARLRERDRDFAAAADLQQKEVLEPLEGYYRSIDAAQDRDPEAEQVRQSLAARLADAYGTLGGLWRKLGQHEKSLTLYRAGADLERDRRNRIAVAYNLTNTINLTLLLHPERITDPALGEDIRETLARLRRRADFAGGSDFWAVADCGLLALLAGESQLASDYYARLAAFSGVEGWMYRSVADMLIALGNALELVKPELTSRLQAEAKRLGPGS